MRFDAKAVAEVCDAVDSGSMKSSTTLTRCSSTPSAEILVNAAGSTGARARRAAPSPPPELDARGMPGRMRPRPATARRPRPRALRVSASSTSGAPSATAPRSPGRPSAPRPPPASALPISRPDSAAPRPIAGERCARLLELVALRRPRRIAPLPALRSAVRSARSACRASVAETKPWPASCAWRCRSALRLRAARRTLARSAAARACCASRAPTRSCSSRAVRASRNAGAVRRQHGDARWPASTGSPASARCARQRPASGAETT